MGFFKTKPQKMFLIISSTPINCIYCHTPLRSESIAIRCPSCLTLHHEKCWEEGNGCGIFGCKESPKRKK